MEITKEKKPNLPKKRKRASNQGKFHDFSLIIHVTLAIKEAIAADVPFDREAFCERTGYTMDEVEATIENILHTQEKLALERQAYEVPPEDKDFELTGWPLPSDEIELFFASDLEDSALFEVFDSMKTFEQFSSLTGGSSDKEIHDLGILRFVENLFSETFDEEIAFFLMNAFFWILFYKGRTWIPVRSYALELLKLFPEPLLRKYIFQEDFIEEFSYFTKKLLSSRGICSLKARPTPDEVLQGTYAIKATDAFYSLLRPSEKVMLGW